MAKKRLSASEGEITAVWIAPEQLRAERVQAAVDDGATAQQVADLATQPPQGEFREYLGDEIVEGKSQAKLGDRLQWVHPQGEDVGWYERHNTDGYVPVLREEEAE